MKGILIGLQILVFNVACFCQSIDQQLIGSGGNTTIENDKGSITYSIGEVIVDYYKCEFNLRVGFIQAIDVLPMTNAFSRSKTTLIGDSRKAYFVENDKYSKENLEWIIYESSGRIISSGQGNDGIKNVLNNVSSGTYFIQTHNGSKLIGTDKIVISR